MSEKDAASPNEMVKEFGMKADSFARLSKVVELYDANRFLGHQPKVDLVKGNNMKTLDEYIEANPHDYITALSGSRYL